MVLINILIILILINFVIADLDSVLSQVEADVKALGEILTNNIKNKCVPTNSCSYIACSSSSEKQKLDCNNNFKLKECNSTKPNESPCNDFGHLLSNERACVILANNIDSTPVKVTESVEEIVNFGSILNAKFIELYNINPKTYKWMYFGSYNGAHMSYPGKDKCSPFDNHSPYHQKYQERLLSF